MHAYIAPTAIGSARCRASASASAEDGSRCSSKPARARSAPPIAISRRSALSASAAAAAGLILGNVLDAPTPSSVLAQAVVATYAAKELQEVTSDKYGYTFMVPTSGWTKNTAQLSGFRDLVAFVKDGSEGNTNVSMVATSVAGDYKKLTSFGTMDTVINTLVPDGRGGVYGELISAVQDTAKNAYVVEYTITPSKFAIKRHLITVFSLQPGRFILTLTGQTTDDRWKDEEALLRSVAESYKIQLFE